MASLYWVGNGGNWSDATNHWATTSGGTPGAGNLPTTSDDVFFDANSFSSVSQTVTINATANCLSMNWTGATNTPTLGGTSSMNINGSVTLIAAMVMTETGQWTMGGGVNQTFTTNGITITTNIAFSKTSGASVTLQDNLTCTAATGISHTAGTLDINGKTVSTTQFTSSGTTVRTLTMGASAFTCTGTGGWSFTGSNLTFNANTSTITCSGAGVTFAGNGATFNAVILSGSGTAKITGANTFTNLTRTGTAVKTDMFHFSANQTISGTLTLTGNSAVNRLFVMSNTYGTTRTLTCNTTVTASNCDFEDITGAGTASWDLSKIAGYSGDCGGNSGITFTAGLSMYWYQNTGSWSDSTKWFSASAGANNDTGATNGGTFADDSSVGTLVWSNPSNAQTSDNIYATTSGATNALSHYLKATNFGFTIPSGATIVGVKVEVERKSDAHSGTGVVDNTVKLVKGGTIQGNNNADTGTAWPTSDTYKTYGSASDMWGLTLAPSDINASNFGMVINANFQNPSGFTGYIDHIRITVYYTNNHVPLPQDNPTFDASSIGSASQTVTLDMPRAGKTINWTGVTNTPAWAKTTASTIYGSVTMVSGMTNSGTTNLTLGGRGSFTLTSGGLTWTNPIYITAFGGTYTQSDAGSYNTDVFLTDGTFNAGNFNATFAASFDFSGVNTKVITMGSGTWSFSGTGIIWNAEVTGTTINANTSTISFTNTSSTNKTFQGAAHGTDAGLTYNNFSCTGGGTGQVRFTASNTFATFTINAPKTVKFTAGTTTTVSSFVATGTVGNAITITSITAATHTLSDTTGTNSVSYCTISYSIATGGATWDASDGTNTDGGNNTGWVFGGGAAATKFLSLMGVGA